MLVVSKLLSILPKRKNNIYSFSRFKLFILSSYFEFLDLFLEVIIDAYVKAGLVLEKDANQKLKVWCITFLCSFPRFVFHFADYFCNSNLRCFSHQVI